MIEEARYNGECVTPSETETESHQSRSRHALAEFLKILFGGGPG
jgi:hypothetical protein